MVDVDRWRRDTRPELTQSVADMNVARQTNGVRSRQQPWQVDEELKANCRVNGRWRPSTSYATLEWGARRLEVNNERASDTVSTINVGG